MDSNQKALITIETLVNAPIEKVWKCWSEPQHITQWNNASDDWYSPQAENNLKEGGTFTTTMAAKDGSVSFDFGGVYTKVEEHQLIEYKINDGRSVQIKFSSNGTQTQVTETFEAEDMHSHELQKEGWQSILNNFKKYTEAI